MNLYKPLDYLYYKIGISYQVLGVGDRTHPSISGMIATLQLLNFIYLGSHIFRLPLRLNLVICLVLYFVVLAYNFIRYNDNSYIIFHEKWKNESKENKRVHGFLVFLYLLVSLISFFSLIESD